MRSLLGAPRGGVLSLAAVLCVLGCASPTLDPARRTPEDANLLRNGSFENGRAPWYAFEDTGNPAWLPYEATNVARAGEQGARLAISSEDFAAGAMHGIRGGLQRLPLGVLPRNLRGVYRVESWSPSPPSQLYVQVVVGATRPKNMEPAWLNRMPVQVAFSLVGLDRVPFRIRNRKFLFTGPVEPTLNRWIPFEFDLHAVFEREWGRVPEDFDDLRVYFEARFDGAPAPGSPPVSAVVYFDDLYLGD